MPRCPRLLVLAAVLPLPLYVLSLALWLSLPYEVGDLYSRIFIFAGMAVDMASRLLWIGWLDTNAVQGRDGSTWKTLILLGGLLGILLVCRTASDEYLIPAVTPRDDEDHW